MYDLPGLEDECVNIGSINGGTSDEVKIGGQRLSGRINVHRSNSVSISDGDGGGQRQRCSETKDEAIEKKY